MTSVPRRERAAGCVSDLDLDELLAGDLAGQPKELALQAHLETCARCRARFAAFSAIEPPPLSAHSNAPVSARRAPRWRRAAIGLGAAAAAAAVIALVVRAPASAPPTEMGERTKGGLALTVFIKRAGGAVDTVNQEADVHAGDELRFALASSAPGGAVVLGLDASPSVTIYAPAAAPSGAAAPAAIAIEATGSVTLPGSIVADATAGAERIVALVCATPAPPEALRARAATALAAASGRPEQVTSLGSGCLESSVLLHKVANGARGPSSP